MTSLIEKLKALAQVLRNADLDGGARTVDEAQAEIARLREERDELYLSGRAQGFMEARIVVAEAIHDSHPIAQQEADEALDKATQHEQGALNARSALLSLHSAAEEALGALATVRDLAVLRIDAERFHQGWAALHELVSTAHAKLAAVLGKVGT